MLSALLRLFSKGFIILQSISSGDCIMHNLCLTMLLLSSVFFDCSFLWQGADASTFLGRSKHGICMVCWRHVLQKCFSMRGEEKR